MRPVSFCWEPCGQCVRVGVCRPAVDLASVLTPEVMAPILANSEVQQRLMPYLPSGESLPQSTEELNNTLSSPQFQQVECLSYIIRKNWFDFEAGQQQKRFFIFSTVPDTDMDLDEAVHSSFHDLCRSFMLYCTSDQQTIQSWLCLFPAFNI